MVNLLPFPEADNFFSEQLSTPIGLFLQYHNLKQNHAVHNKAELLIITCMDNRIQFNIPRNFAYIIRTGGTNIQMCEFYLSYVIAMTEITHVVIIGHNDCGMVNLQSKKERFIKGMVNKAGWDSKNAEEYFNNIIEIHEIQNEIDFLLKEADRLKAIYSKVCFIPLYYNINDNYLYLMQR